MCLSTAYKNEKKPENAIASNIMMVDVDGDQVILVDLFGIKTVVEGSLKRASLTDGYIILSTKD